MSTGVTEVGKKEVEEVQQDVKCFSFLSFMLKSPSLITKSFKDNDNS